MSKTSEMQDALSVHLSKCQHLLPPTYEVTLICRYKPDDLDADIILSNDDLEKVEKVLNDLRLRKPAQMDGKQ